MIYYVFSFILDLWLHLGIYDFHSPPFCSFQIHLLLLYKLFKQYTNRFFFLKFEMNILDLLAQSSISYHKSSKNNKHKQQLFISVFQQNLNIITAFLGKQQTLQLKLICRGVSYLFIVQDLWLGIKLNVAEQKVIDYDDYQFIQEQPKQISKEDKKIRIHSLKKNNMSNTKKIVRQPSNVKQKKMMLSTLNSQFQFRNTQIGFKRLLKTSNQTLHPKNNLDIEDSISQKLIDFIKIPNEFAITDLLINVKDPWTKNISRANNLITLVRKWNEYHTRFFAILKRPDSQLMVLFKKLIRLDQQIGQYSLLTSSEPYISLITLLQGAEKNLLIQEQLNKYGRIFIESHIRLKKILQKKQLEKTINKVHQMYQKMKDLNMKEENMKQSDWIQSIGYIDESFENLIQNQFQIKSYLQTSILNIFSEVTQALTRKTIFVKQSEVELNKITMTFIIQNPQFCELCFEMLFNINSKLVTLHTQLSKVQSNSNNVIPLKNSFQNKYRSLSGICWNISKYIKKLIKQLQVKQKKNKQLQKIKILKNFLQNQKTNDLKLWNLSSIQYSQKYYKQFKQKIQSLKQQMLKE